MPRDPPRRWSTALLVARRRRAVRRPAAASTAAPRSTPAPTAAVTEELEADGLHALVRVAVHARPARSSPGCSRCRRPSAAGSSATCSAGCAAGAAAERPTPADPSRRDRAGRRRRRLGQRLAAALPRRQAAALRRPGRSARWCCPPGPAACSSALAAVGAGARARRGCRRAPSAGRCAGRWRSSRSARSPRSSRWTAAGSAGRRTPPPAPARWSGTRSPAAPRCCCSPRPRRCRTCCPRCAGCACRRRSSRSRRSIYRLLFVLLESLRTIREAQTARMGHSSLRRVLPVHRRARRRRAHPLLGPRPPAAGGAGRPRHGDRAAGAARGAAVVPRASWPPRVAGLAAIVALERCVGRHEPPDRWPPTASSPGTSAAARVLDGASLTVPGRAAAGRAGRQRLGQDHAAALPVRRAAARRRARSPSTAPRLEHTRRGLRAHRQEVQLVLQDPDDQLFSASVAQDVSFGPLNLGPGRGRPCARGSPRRCALLAVDAPGRPAHPPALLRRAQAGGDRRRGRDAPVRAAARRADRGAGPLRGRRGPGRAGPAAGARLDRRHEHPRRRPGAALGRRGGRRRRPARWCRARPRTCSATTTCSPGPGSTGPGR